MDKPEITVPVLFGLYKHRTTSSYDDEGGGSSSDEWLIGVDTTAAALQLRWNSARDAERAKLKAENAHHSYWSRVEPNIPDDKLSVNYSGSTGGGYAGVSYRLYIKPIPQFDEVKS